MGSTAIKGIKAKPIINIAVEVDDFDEVMALSPILKEDGFTYRKREVSGIETCLWVI